MDAAIDKMGKQTYVTGGFGDLVDHALRGTPKYHWWSSKGKPHTGREIAYVKNMCETIGQATLRPWTKVPEIMAQAFTPQILSVAFTLGAMGTLTLVMYPIKSYHAIARGINWIRDYMPSFNDIYFGLYATLMVTLAGTGLKAYGRLSNRELMGKFYDDPKNPQINLFEAPQQQSTAFADIDE